MKTTVNHSTDLAKNEIRKCLEGKSSYEMTVWLRDHAQYLSGSVITTRVRLILGYNP